MAEEESEVELFLRGPRGENRSGWVYDDWESGFQGRKAALEEGHT